MVTITYFVHSITTDNEHGIATGWLPGELSECGREKAVELGTQVAGRHFDSLFCSDLRRAVESAELIFGDTYTAVQDTRLREANYGDLNGQPHTFKDSMTDYIDRPFPNGESYRDIERRMRDFCDDMKQKYDDKHIAVISSQGPQLALEVILNGRSWPQAIAEDWRRTKAWQPGWDYFIN